MISDADRAAIEAHVCSLGIETWPSPTSTQRDLIRRALAPVPITHAAAVTASISAA